MTPTILYDDDEILLSNEIYIWSLSSQIIFERFNHKVNVDLDTRS